MNEIQSILIILFGLFIAFFNLQLGGLIILFGMGLTMGLMYGKENCRKEGEKK